MYFEAVDLYRNNSIVGLEHLIPEMFIWPSSGQILAVSLVEECCFLLQATITQSMKAEP
jgi:hypothetical protein